MENGKIVSEIDIGDQVVCDYCDTEYTKDSPETGGILVGSYAVCPKCIKRTMLNLIAHNELSEVRDTCPDGMTYHAWVMQMRGGNNTISVKSFKTPDDMLNAIRGVK